MKELKNVYRVQRLEAPVFRDGEPFVNPFSFGGGGSGISREGMQALGQVFSFDYMGAAEYEFDTPRKAFNRLYEDKDKFASWEIEIKGKKVFVLGEEELKDDINDVIEKISAQKQWLKEPTYLHLALEEDDFRTKGWIDYDNSFMFFVDEKMFEGTKELFSIK